MIMHGDPTTSTGLPLTLGKFQPKEATEGTVGPTIANRGSEMAMVTTRPTQAEGMSVGEMKREVEAGAHHLEKTYKRDVTLGGSLDRITSLTGSEQASSGEETNT